MSQKGTALLARSAVSLFLMLASERCWPAVVTQELSPYGVASSAQASGAYAAWLPKMAAAGIRWVRLFPDWNQIEPSKGKWDWSLMDSMINSAASNGISVSGLFLYNAKWINSVTHTFPTNDYPAWSDYVSNVVRHASGRICYWEVWNEPQSFAAGGTPADYGHVVALAYNAAKAAAPDAQVGIGVASVDVYYLEHSIRAGAADHFDYICVHPYEVLGTLSSGQEALCMSIVPTLRKMLAAVDPPKTNVPIWFTELGEEMNKQVNAAKQAQDLVKAYVLGIAQGVSVIEWFEPQEGGYAMGLLDAQGKPRRAYDALKNLTATLGPNPAYKGWVLINERDYGFVFQNATNMVVVAWAPPGKIDELKFERPVTFVDPLSGLPAEVTNCSLSNAPVFVVDVPSNLVTQAQANRNRPFPWNGDYTGADMVSITMGNPNVEKGLHQLNVEVSSAPVMISGEPARDCSVGAGVTFTVDPNFVSYTHTPLQISAVVRKISADDNPGFNLKYEAASGRKGIGWNFVPGADRWYTLSWTVADDEFVGNWGYHFSLDSDSKLHSRYYLQRVTVTRLVPPR
jgi:hypothetical protein